MSAAPHGNSAGKTTEHRGVIDVALYATARLLLAAAVTAAIYGAARLAGINEFPVVVAALFGLTIAMPLGMWIFTPLRRRATVALAVAGERRRAERERLRARLRGEDPDDPNSDQGAGES